MKEKKKCDFSNIYNMHSVEDIPYHLPFNMSIDWYIEFYFVASHILKNKDDERYQICMDKLNELITERRY